MVSCEREPLYGVLWTLTSDRMSDHIATQVDKALAGGGAQMARECERCGEVSEENSVCDRCGDAVCYACQIGGHWGIEGGDLCRLCQDEDET